VATILIIFFWKSTAQISSR